MFGAVFKSVAKLPGWRSRTSAYHNDWTPQKDMIEMQMYQSAGQSVKLEL